MAHLEGPGRDGRGLDGLAVDDRHQRSVHSLPERRVEAVVRTAQRRVTDGVSRAAQQTSPNVSCDSFIARSAVP